MQTTNEERTAAEVRAEVRTYEEARPKLVRDVEGAARLMEEERERLIRGAGGSLSARDRTTAAHSAAVAAVEDVDAKLRELRLELEEAERREWVDGLKAELAEIAAEAAEKRAEHADVIAVATRRLASWRKEAADAWQGWDQLRRAFAGKLDALDRAERRRLREQLEEAGCDLAAAKSNPSIALRLLDRPTVERAVVELVAKEVTRRRRG